MTTDPRGSWFRVYARQVRQHPKFHALTLHELGGWLVLRAECELLDGNPITDRSDALLVLKRYKATRPGALLDRLVAVRLLDVTPDGGYAIHDREDHDRQKAPSDEAEATRLRKAAERARKAAQAPDMSRGHEGVTSVTENASRPVTTAAHARAEQSRAESDSEPAYEGGPGDDDPNHDPLTLICRLVGYWPKPADHAEFRAAIEDMARRYRSEWTLEAIPQAYELLALRGRVRHWDLKRRAELILGERARSEELAIRVADQEKARQEREEVKQHQLEQTEEERERQALYRKAVRLWTKGGMQGEVPESIAELRQWVAAHASGTAPPPAAPTARPRSAASG